ncbi:Tox-REase-5 domain-containing protein [Gordonia sp. ABSL1-1]|uniref:Tox-REase-5 domain-containing protein n=1 Tax=Gordonia sp. ABSL1-1 TaxID=3053923 RepID=UPI0025738FDA|nr:Tox-REase-5 domain-containing protein [Gordonia sp. ABSL1-1]MDL9936532.1 Tox-REase-5 domain-containing protein [Gordonia sp. ABSL1-1]
MRTALAFFATSLIGFVVLSVLVLTGVVAQSNDGSGIANQATRDQAQVAAAATALAGAPGARYTGDVIVGGATTRVRDLVVTAAGDVQGQVAADGQTFDYLQIGDAAYVKAGASFWMSLPRSETVRVDAAAAADKWALVPRGFLGVDLGQTLRPSRLALSSVDDRLAESDTDPPTEGAQLPDARVVSRLDPQQVSSDARDDGGRAIHVGENTFDFGPDGVLVGISGPLGRAGGTQPVTTTRLKVTLATKHDVTTYYSTVEGLKDLLSRVPAPMVDIPKPSGRLASCAPTYCLLEYSFGNRVEGADRGTVTVRQTSTMSVNGVPVGTCARTIEMPINGRGVSSCPFVYASPRTELIRYKADSNFAIAAHVEKDVNVIIEAVGRGRQIATAAPGHWYPGGYKRSPAARSYNSQITGAPSGFVYMVGDFPFDGMEPDGTLLVAAAPGYDAHLLPDGTFDPQWAGTNDLVERARRARTAAGEHPVRWVFAEQRSADAMKKLLADNQVTGVEIVVIPPAP